MGTPSLPPPAPTPAAPPTELDPAIKEARRRARRRFKGRTARQTVLTGPTGLVARGDISTPSLLGSSNLGGGASLIGG